MNYSQAKRSLAAVVLLLAAYGGGMLAQTNVKLTLVSGPGQDREEGAAMVCDGQLSTKWCIDSPRQMPYTLVLDAGTPSSFAEYGFVTGDDTETYPDRNPVTWRVSGSNDKQEWTVLDNQKNSRRMAAENWQEYRFRLAGKGAFRYYRFEFFRVAGGTRIQLSEIIFHETVQSPLKVTLSQGGVREASPRGGLRRSEGASMVCDGLLSTKWCIDDPRQMPYSIVLDAGSQTNVSEYGFVTGDDTHSYPSRNPVAWRVSGSNDKQEWTVIDEQKYNRRLRDENEQEYRFRPSGGGKYRYYRFEFVRMTEGTRIQLSEINLYGPSQPTPNP